jgi:hypothetical protein
MVPGLVVHGNFDFIRLVDAEVVDFVDPFVGSCRLGAPLDGVLHLDVDERFWSSTKATGSCMINIGNGMDA